MSDTDFGRGKSTDHQLRTLYREREKHLARITELEQQTSLDDEIERRRHKGLEEIERHGGRWCDSPACNCGGVHWNPEPRARAKAQSAEAFLLWLGPQPVTVEVRGVEGGHPFKRQVSLSDALTDFRHFALQGLEKVETATAFPYRDASSVEVEYLIVPDKGEQNDS